MHKRVLLSTLLLIASLVNGQKTERPASSTNGNQPAAQTGGIEFQVGEIVDVWDPIEKGWFPSSIVKKEANRYFIHFTNYDPKWDTWVTPERVRRAGIGNKKDPAPVSLSASGSGQQPAATGTINASEVSIAMPVLVPGKNITINIGDPFLYKDPSTSGLVKLFVTNLDFQDRLEKHKYFAVNNGNGYYNWKDMQLDPSFNYTVLPEKAGISVNDNYKTGDLIETYWTFNDKFGEYEIVPGIIVSQDGDNYYIYFNESNGRSTQFEWRYISDIRSIGSSKKIELVPQRGNKKEDFDKCSAALSACNLGKYSNRWDFLWYYRHDMRGYNIAINTESMAFRNAKELQAALEFYECMSQAVIKYPNTGYSGRMINERLDVQYGFLKDYKTYIRKAFDTRIRSITQNIVTDARNGYYKAELARTDGKEMLKKEMIQLCKEFEASYALLGGKIDYPFKELEAAYDAALPLFLQNNLLPNEGLVLDGHNYSGKDARVEQLCIANFKEKYPGSQALKSGCYNNEYLVELNALGIPVYRTRSVLIILQGPLFRTKVRAQYTIREEYLGGGKYGNHSFPRAGDKAYIK